MNFEAAGSNLHTTQISCAGGTLSLTNWQHGSVSVWGTCKYSPPHVNRRQRLHCYRIVQ